MANNSLCEIFGFPSENFSKKANRYRKLKLCPYNNKVPNCTKDKASNPLGVCSIFNKDTIAITCPIRFRQDWLIAEDSASFFFPENSQWTSLTEVRLNDKNGITAGNIDIVLVSYDLNGKITDFGALEIQAVYISGNVRNPFEQYIKNPKEWVNTNSHIALINPRPDYLSSSRKRLVPQLIYKGGILNAWGKKIAVALDNNFFNTLPRMETVNPNEADIVWLVYELEHNTQENMFSLSKTKFVYTRFNDSLEKIIRPEIGNSFDFIAKLQDKLDEKLEATPPRTNTLNISSIGDIDAD